MIALTRSFSLLKSLPVLTKEKVFQATKIKRIIPNIAPEIAIIVILFLALNTSLAGSSAIINQSNLANLIAAKYWLWRFLSLYSPKENNSPRFINSPATAALQRLSRKEYRHHKIFTKKAATPQSPVR